MPPTEPAPGARGGCTGLGLPAIGDVVSVRGCVRLLCLFVRCGQKLHREHENAPTNNATRKSGYFCCCKRSMAACFRAEKHSSRWLLAVLLVLMKVSSAQESGSGSGDEFSSGSTGSEMSSGDSNGDFGSGDAGSGDLTSMQPVSSPPKLGNVRVAFTASGDVSDFDDTRRTKNPVSSVICCWSWCHSSCG